MDAGLAVPKARAITDVFRFDDPQLIDVEAIAKLRSAVDEYRVAGIKTTLGLFREILRDEEFARGEIDTGFIGRLLDKPRRAAADTLTAAEAAAILAALEAEVS